MRGILGNCDVISVNIISNKALYQLTFSARSFTNVPQARLFFLA